MFLNRRMTLEKKFGDMQLQIEKLKECLNQADAVVIGAGAGLSTSAGFDYSGERFQKYFSDFAKKYGLTDMYSAGFYPFNTLEEQWAFWSRYIFINRYMDAPKPVYQKLYELVKDKDYFVLTTNVDHCFQKSGFDKHRLFYTQGDYGLWQCSKPCHAQTYDNETVVRQMVEAQGFTIKSEGKQAESQSCTVENQSCTSENQSKQIAYKTDRMAKSEQDKHLIYTHKELILPEGVTPKMTVPTELVPRCPKCGRPMNMNLRADDTFVEDEGWHVAAEYYSEFLRRHEHLNVVFLELGVGYNTPGIIKYPFWHMTAQNPKATYVCINYGDAGAPNEIRNQSICIDGDIGEILLRL